MFCSTHRFHFDCKIGFATGLLYSLKPVRHMYVVNEIGKSMAAYGHNFHQLSIDQIQFAAIKPKPTAISAVIQNDIGFT